MWYPTRFYAWKFGYVSNLFVEQAMQPISLRFEDIITALHWHDVTNATDDEIIQINQVDPFWAGEIILLKIIR